MKGWQDTILRQFTLLRVLDSSPWIVDVFFENGPVELVNIMD